MARGISHSFVSLLFVLRQIDFKGARAKAFSLLGNFESWKWLRRSRGELDSERKCFLETLNEGADSSRLTQAMIKGFRRMFRKKNWNLISELSDFKDSGPSIDQPHLTQHDLTAMLFTNARYFTTAFATLKTNRRQMDIPKSSSPQITPRISIGFNVALKENLQVSKHGCGIFQLFRGKQHKHLFSIMFRPFSARSRHPSDASTKASAAEGRKTRMQSLININLTWASGDK